MATVLADTKRLAMADFKGKSGPRLVSRMWRLRSAGRR